MTSTLFCLPNLSSSNVTEEAPLEHPGRSTSTEPKSPPPPSDQHLLALQRELRHRLHIGFLNAGAFTTRCRRFLRPRLERPVRVWLESYAGDPRWWRITYDFGSHESIYGPLRDYGELTLHREELTKETGEYLALFLREFPRWPWPLFAHDPRYPRHAWTRMAEQTYTEDRLLREARQRRLAERALGQG